LIIAKEMVLKMGGKIWVKSEPEKGTLFTFSLLKEQNS
jgi:signal transduction histidine kinase